MTRLTVAALAALIALPASAQDGDVARGEYLVQGPMGCGNCHTPIGPAGPEFSKDLTGRVVEDIQPFLAIAPNITPAGDIADWSDEELGRAIREGLRPDGTIIGPPMPFQTYRHISDQDLSAIVAYLRSLPATEGDETRTSEYRIPLPPAYGPPIDAAVTAPERGATVEYGEYMVALTHCMECHSPVSPETGAPDLQNRMGEGGFEFHGPWGISVSTNLTHHPDGLDEYSDEEIKAMITQGQHPDGHAMLPPMPYAYLGRMTPEDLDAVVMYLRTIPGKPDA